jgi:hypothetical protein
MRFLRSVSATPLERTRALPGDEWIPDAIASFTHAVTIERPREEIWPWLVQMGAGSRAGWYSYDFIDNRGQPSADRIEPALQAMGVGSLFPALPGVTEGFHVLAFQPFVYLLLGWKPAAAAAPLTTWAFVLDERPGWTTRLIVRARGGRGYPSHGLPRWLNTWLIRVGHFFMERKQLLTIASRVELRPRGSSVAELRATA